MATSVQMKFIVKELSTRDVQLKRIIDSSPLCSIGSNPRVISNFEALVQSIISQQLAVSAAASIFQRVKDLAQGYVTVADLSSISEIEMRKAGVSGAKFKTINGLTDSIMNKEIDIENLHKMSEDQQIFESLTKLWGIGPWTVDMFLIFQLGRLDIWPVSDLGVKRGWAKMHLLKNGIEPEILKKKGEKFRPYRSVVAWYCWRALD